MPPNVEKNSLRVIGWFGKETDLPCKTVIAIHGVVP